MTLPSTEAHARRQVERPRVAFDLSLPSRGRTGTSVYASSLCEALERRDDVQVLRFMGRTRSKSGSFGARLRNAIVETRWTQLQVPRLCRRRRADILHAPAAVSPVRAPCPVVVSVHDLSFLTFPETPAWGLYARAAMALSARCARAFITFSAAVRDGLIDRYGVPGERTFVVPHGVDRAFGAVLGNDRQARVLAAYGLRLPYILFVGAADARKGLDTLIKGLAWLSSRGHDGVRLVIAGPPGNASADLDRLIRERDLEHRVTQLGFVPREDLPALYQAAHLFAFPSLDEGFGLPVLEAMAAGTPVVVSRAGGLPETAGEAALLVEPRDVGALGAAMARILNDHALADELRGRGRRHAAQFTWARSAAETLDVYRHVLRGDA